VAKVKFDQHPQANTCRQILAPHRWFFYSRVVAGVVGTDPYEEREKERRVCLASEANLISSLTASGLHAPVLDIDFEAQLVPSRTPGHYHLYLDKPIPWRRYKKLLRALMKAGIIEKGYYGASVARRMTFVRWDYWDWVRRGTDVKAAAVADLIQWSQELKGESCPTNELSSEKSPGVKELSKRRKMKELEASAMDV
jgi:hypothetical protein